MEKRLLHSTLILFVIGCCLQARAQTSLPPEVAKHGYADLVIFNGKIVSMDDAGLNTNPGTVYQAMAVKGDRIIALGADARIRGLANADTRMIDLRGQTVIPGIVESHIHLFGGGAVGEEMGIRTPGNGISIRIPAGRDFETTRMKVETALREAVEKVQPGEWIVANISANPQEGVSQIRVQAWIAKQDLIPLSRIDPIVPQNPVFIQGGIRGNVNTKALEIMKMLFPDYDEFVRQAIEPDADKTGEVTALDMAVLQWEVFYKDKPLSMLSEMLRRTLERAASHGMTTFSSRLDTSRIVDAYSLLNREKKMPIRFGMLWEVHVEPDKPEFVRHFYEKTGNFTGVGNDFFWIHGVASERWDTSFPMSCLGPDAPAPPATKAKELCLKPGDIFWDTLQNALAAGWRLAGIHGIGSDGVRRYLQMVEMAMKQGGMTEEDIREMRLTVEHADVLGKVPDVVAALKRFGVTVSVNPNRLQRYTDFAVEYGPEIERMMVPVKSLLDQGVKVVGQTETMKGYGDSWKTLMTRKIPNGRIVAPEEAVDRVTVMKMWTNWASEYVLKEDVLGSLELGKFADFVVLDKDYFTISVDEIPTIRPQATAVGGKFVFLDQGYAGKLGMQPVGWQYPEGYRPWASGGPATE